MSDKTAGLDPDALRQHLIEIDRLQSSGRMGEAEARADALLARHPGSMPLLLLRARAARLAGKHGDARDYLARARALAPQSAAVLSEAGQLAADEGSADEALEHFRALTGLQPQHADAWFNLGLAAEKIQRHQEAVGAYRKALELGVAEPAEVTTRLGGVLLAVNDEEQAERCFDQVLASDPGHPQALYGKGMIQQTLGDFGAAEQSFRRALDADPGFVEVYQQIAELKKFADLDDPLVARLRSLLEKPQPEQAREKLHFALGKICNDCGDFDAAFSHFEAANQLKKARQPRFDHDQHQALTTAVIEFFDSDWLGAVQAPPAAEITPVFIVGMPRSGTSLVEQILSSHSRVAGAGELPFMDNIARTAVQDYPQGVAEWPAEAQAKHREEYLQVLATHGERLPFVTDKFPGNFLHLGLIHQLFPEARFVHCQRDAMDNCLSIFIQDFGTGNYYANDLDDIAFYYRQQSRLMAHWRELFGAQLITVRYEDLVEDQAGESRRLLHALGLEWEEACLAFDKNPRKVSTLSRWQVRQPIYKSAAGRWRRYAQHLEGLRKALDYEA